MKYAQIMQYLSDLGPLVVKIILVSVALKMLADSLMASRTQSMLKKAWGLIRPQYQDLSLYMKRNSFYETFPAIQRPFDRFDMAASYGAGGLWCGFGLIWFVLMLLAPSVAGAVIVGFTGVGYLVAGKACLARGNALYSKLRNPAPRVSRTKSRISLASASNKAKIE